MANSSACLICDSVLEPFMDFGNMPIANGFLTADQVPEERFHPLRISLCEECGMVQLLNPVDRSLLFHAERTGDHVALVALDDS